MTAALDRVDGLARGLRSGGDARTLEQLRSDLALDLLLFGWASPDQVPEPARATFAGQAPSAHVTLVVALTTMLGLDDQPGEIPGHGFVSAAVARNIAGASGSVWRRLVTDPRRRDGAGAVDARATAPRCGWRSRWPPSTGSARHPVAPSRPTAAMSTTRSRGRPGRPAVRDLKSRHRRHHNHKTRGTWKAHPRPDGTTRWTTVSGRDYLSHRFRYDDPLARPVAPAEMSSADVGPPPF